MQSSIYTKALIVFLVAISFLYSCKHDPIDIEGIDLDDQNPIDTTGTNSDICDPDSVYFSNDVLPIIASNCAISGCHGQGSAQDGVNFDTYANIMEQIRPGRPDNSDLYESITEDDVDKRMPKDLPPLSVENINTIRTWIEQGAKNNSCDNSTSICDTSNVSFTGEISTILSNHCLGCHSDALQQGGVNLSDYNKVLVYANNGKLFGTVNHDPGFSPMPQGQPKLDDCKINTIKAWINQGAQNN